MTINELKKWCEEEEAKGNGETKVIWQSLSHTWDVEPTLTTRGGVPVVLINP